MLVRFVTFCFCLFTSFGACAQEALTPPAGHAQRVGTREGVSVPIYAYWRDDAVATVVLFSGGAGGYGQIGEDGWPAGGNFLIRTGKQWASHPFNVIMVGRPSDGIDLALGSVRTGDKHAADTQAILKTVLRKSPVPIWVVGTSMGTISAAAAAIRDTEQQIAGVVLTSSILAYKVPGAVPTQKLSMIRVPTLVVHHANDACWACLPSDAKRLADALSNAPVKKIMLLSGGSGASGDPCEPLHNHGYVGMQREVVDLIANWIIRPVE
jgi:pimeloyl-ACP methyl ester carboxylesterase